jgi:murein DD-endopeptidase MepM/ murein hydrolase activator NlpD
MRVHPITGVWHMHTGIDLANVVGTSVAAARAGRVVHVEDSSIAYGKMVIIDHGGGIRTLYGHLSSYLVSKGQYVTAGQPIGRMGNTGRSTGSHLHFSVIRNGRWEDPLKHLP